jgi:hypothetical protein
VGQIIYIYSHVTLSKVLSFYNSSMSTRIIYFLIYLSHFFHYAQPFQQATAASTQSARWTTLDDFSILENSVKIQSHSYSQAQGYTVGQDHQKCKETSYQTKERGKTT